MMIQLRLQKRVLLQLTTNNTPTKDYSHTDDKTTRPNGTMGSNHSRWKGSLIDGADDNIIYRINGTVDVVAIDKVMS